MFAFLHHHWSISISTIRNNPAKITFSHKSFFHVCNEIFKDSLKAKLCKFTKANWRGTREIKISWGDLVGLISKHRFSSSAPSRNLSRVERIESRIQRDGIEKREREMKWKTKAAERDTVLHLFLETKLESFLVLAALEATT